MATFAIEMDMLVIIIVVPMVALAELITHAVAAVLNDMYQMVLPKKCERTKDARFVDGHDARLQFAERHRPACSGQCFGHSDAVGSGFDAMLCEQLFTLLLTNHGAKIQKRF